MSRTTSLIHIRHCCARSRPPGRLQRSWRANYPPMPVFAASRTFGKREAAKAHAFAPFEFPTAQPAPAHKPPVPS